jgi:hypothetical protein
MPEFRRDFEQRFEYKAALEHTRMWERESRGVDRCVTEEQEVYVDKAWTAQQAAHPSHLPFDAQHRGQQLQGKEARLASHRHIQKPGLGGYILRLGFID